MAAMVLAAADRDGRVDLWSWRTPVYIDVRAKSVSRITKFTRPGSSAN